MYKRVETAPIVMSKMTSHYAGTSCTNERRVRKRDKKVRRDVI